MRAEVERVGVFGRLTPTATVVALVAADCGVDVSSGVSTAVGLASGELESSNMS